MEKVLILFMSSLRGEVNIKISKDSNLKLSAENYGANKNNNITNQNVISALRKRFFEKIDKENQLDLIRSVLDKPKKRKKSNNYLHHSFKPDNQNLKLKFENNLKNKQLIFENKRKRSLYWESKFDIKKEYFALYNNLKENYEKKQNFMFNWMQIISVYIVLNAANNKLEHLKDTVAYKFKIKYNYFKLWKNSKKTETRIKQLQDVKLLKSFIRYSHIKYIFKAPYLTTKTHSIISKLFTKILFMKQLDQKVRIFAMKGNVKS